MAHADATSVLAIISISIPIHAMTPSKAFEAAFAQRPDIQKGIVQTIGTSFDPGKGTKLTDVPLQLEPKISKGCLKTLHTTLMIFGTLGLKVRHPVRMNPHLRSENWNIDQSRQLGGTKAPIAPWPTCPSRYPNGRSTICKWARRPEYGHPAPLLVNPPSNLG